MDIEVRIETSPGVWQSMSQSGYTNEWPIFVWLADPPIRRNDDDAARSRGAAGDGGAGER